VDVERRIDREMQRMEGLEMRLSKMWERGLEREKAAVNN